MNEKLERGTANIGCHEVGEFAIATAEEENEDPTP